MANPIKQKIKRFLRFNSGMSSLFNLKIKLAYTLNRLGIPQSIIAHSRWKIILAFHRVIPQSKASELGLHPSLYITPETFEALLFSIQKIGEFVDIYSLLSKSSSYPMFSVTFDDGWIDTYTTAYPILKRLGIPSSIFISTSLIDNGLMNWTEEIAAQYATVLKKDAGDAIKARMKLDPFKNSRPRDIYSLIESLKEIPESLRSFYIEGFYSEIGVKGPIKGQMLSWAQLRELEKEGASIGSHTHSHVILEETPKEKVLEELCLSKAIIKERLGIDAHLFCYPNARYDKSQGTILESLDYAYGFILGDKRVSNNVSPYFVPRFLVYEDIVPLLYCRFIKGA